MSESDPSQSEPSQPEVSVNTQTPSTEPPSDSTISNEIIEIGNLSTGTVGAPVYNYYDIDTATSLILTSEEAQNNTQWDIAFKRTNISLNTHIDAPTTLFFTGNTHEFYEPQTGNINVERFVNATKESERALFENINLSTLNVPLIVDNKFNPNVFVGDRTEPAIKNFYSYDPVNHMVSANSDTYFITRTQQALSKFSVKNIIQNRFGVDEYTVSVALQKLNESGFGTSKNIIISKADCNNANVYIDFATGMSVDGNAPWDINIPCKDDLLTLAINVNTQTKVLNDATLTNTDGIDVNTLAFLPWVNNTVTVAAYKAAGDARSSLGWGEYNITNNMLLWPNFATYIINTSQGYYLFQVTDYYHTETQASGNFSVRHIKLDESAL